MLQSSADKISSSAVFEFESIGIYQETTRGGSSGSGISLIGKELRPTKNQITSTISTIVRNFVWVTRSRDLFIHHYPSPSIKFLEIIDYVSDSLSEEDSFAFAMLTLMPKPRNESSKSIKLLEPVYECKDSSRPSHNIVRVG